MIIVVKNQVQFHFFVLLCSTLILAVFVFLFFKTNTLVRPREILQTVTSSTTPNQWKRFIDDSNQFTFEYPATWGNPVRYQESTHVEYVFGNYLSIREGFTYSQILNRPLTFKEEVNSMKDYQASEALRIDGYPAVILTNKNNQDINIFVDSPIGTLVLTFGANPNSSDVFNLAHVQETFKFLTKARISPTCKPRPPCLDETPRCMIAETADMCPPKTTPTLNAPKIDCPQSGWVNCMPGSRGIDITCSKEAMDWYKNNCPDYQGVAY